MIFDIKPQLYDSENIEQLCWPNSTQAQYAKYHLLPMIKDGVENYVKNVKTRIFALAIGDYVFPLSVNEKEYDNSYVASNYASIGYLKELADRKSGLLRPFLDPTLFFVGSFLKAVKINKVVIVNNYFFSTNLCPSLSPSIVREMTDCLVSRFPDHLIVIRSVHQLDEKALFSSLKTEGYRLIGCRSIFTYDPIDKEFHDYSAKRKRNADLRLIDQMNYEIIDHNSVKEGDICRFLELYHLLYLAKYSALSPKYTDNFIANAIRHRLLNIIALKKNDKVDGVFGYYTLGGIFTDPFFGYDTHHPERDKIYRMLSMLAIAEAEKLNIKANFGSGGDNYKKQRGLRMQLEYVGIYHKHLPLHRRGLWSLSETLMNNLVFRSSKNP